ncbi:MAG: hypothetical protein J3R72DRAFT_441291 [Linnemannia gamsii]|nr:MAG: hypothetical protein J3R72DRAFT_441291 [Linnemannia gamsii]
MTMLLIKMMLLLMLLLLLCVAVLLTPGLFGVWVRISIERVMFCARDMALVLVHGRPVFALVMIPFIPIVGSMVRMNHVGLDWSETNLICFLSCCCCRLMVSVVTWGIFGVVEEEKLSCESMRRCEWRERRGNVKEDKEWL